HPNLHSSPPRRSSDLRHDNYDLEGDTRDQEYDGLAGESDSTVKAVQRTAGMIATYRGSAIEALYSANAGGITEDSENVYANALRSEEHTSELQSRGHL